MEPYTQALQELDLMDPEILYHLLEALTVSVSVGLLWLAVRFATNRRRRSRGGKELPVSNRFFRVE